MSLIIKSLLGRSMKDRRKPIPPKLKLGSEAISNTIEEARRIKELSIQEEVIVEQGQRGPGTGQGTDHEDHAIAVLDQRSDALYPRVNRWTGFTQIPPPPAA